MPLGEGREVSVQGFRERIMREDVGEEVVVVVDIGAAD